MRRIGLLSVMLALLLTLPLFAQGKKTPLVVNGASFYSLKTNSWSYGGSVSVYTKGKFRVDVIGSKSGNSVYGGAGISVQIIDLKDALHQLFKAMNLPDGIVNATDFTVGGYGALDLGRLFQDKKLVPDYGLKIAILKLEF